MIDGVSLTIFPNNGIYTTITFFCWTKHVDPTCFNVPQNFLPFFLHQIFKLEKFSVPFQAMKEE
jgi:hypothetical protein